MRFFVPFLLSVSLLAQDTPPLIRSDTQEVLLDLVVRDKKERFVRDLKAEDIEVFEDGVKQQIQSFRLVTGAEARGAPRSTSGQISPAAPGGNTPATKLAGLNVVSIVFERMSPESRYYAREAAQEFLKTEANADTYIGLFSLDYRLNALQTYTTDRAALVKAIDFAATGNYTQFRRQSENIYNNLLVTITNTRTGEIKISQMGDKTQSSSMSTAGASAQTGESQAILAHLQQKQLDMVTYGAGWRSLEGLLSLVRAQSALPGRKTVIFLSEGFIVPWQVKNVFESIISAANRANVSIYCVDVAGLRTTSPGRAGFDQVNSIGELVKEQRNWESAAPDVLVELTQVDDRRMMALHSNTQENMYTLAEGTGGFMVANTNDLRRPMAKIMEDARTHYELAYVPTAKELDGKFRKVEVKVKAGAHVQTRNGYFALPMLDGEPLAPFETECLRALNMNPAPQQFQLRAAVIPFDRPGAVARRQEIVFEAPMKDITLAEVNEGHALRAHLSFLGIIRDSQGKIVQRISRDLPVNLVPDQKAAARQGNVIFHRPVFLGSGHYTLEAVAYDWEGKEASVRRIPLEVPPPPELGLSGIVRVRRTYPIQGTPDYDDPFESPEGKIVPTLGTASPAGVQLYFVVYPAANVTAKPQLSVELLQNGEPVQVMEPELPAAGANGAIPIALSVTPGAGNYEVKVTLQQGSLSATRTLSLQVADTESQPTGLRGIQ